MNNDSEKLHRLILESRNKFRTLVDGIDDEIFSIDNDYKITSVNHSLARTLNCHPKELVGQTCYETIYNLKIPCEEAGDSCPALAARRSARIETVLKEINEDNQSTRYLEIRAMPLLDEHKKEQGEILVRRDVTLQKEAEKQIREYNKRLEQEVKRQTAVLEETNKQLRKQRNELERANKELKELEQLKRDLTNMVIHDLKGPLSEIVANLEMIKYEPLSDFQREVLESAILGSGEMSRMIANLLGINRMEEHRMQLEISSFDPRKAIEGIVKRYRPLAKLKDIAIFTNIPAGLPLIETDSLLFERILINLITNAIDHTMEGGQITVRAGTGDNKFYFEIQDNGRGIPEELIDKIFDKFSQGREGVPKTGSGLGLTFCKMAIEALNGRIGVKSESGKGTIFFCSLPLKRHAVKID
ncbi:MAG: PAS domain-containing protein [Deltaproteobacteria bacterium]|nr:PAS domain-containing protein [Deltaproteobacteria bacterium]